MWTKCVTKLILIARTFFFRTTATRWRDELATQLGELGLEHAQMVRCCLVLLRASHLQILSPTLEPTRAQTSDSMSLIFWIKLIVCGSVSGAGEDVTRGRGGAKEEQRGRRYGVAL